MSSTPSSHSDPDGQPARLWAYLGEPAGAKEFVINGQHVTLVNNIPRAGAVRSAGQSQTEETFAFKWQKRDTFNWDASLSQVKSWLVERYGNPAIEKWLADLGESPLLIDACCGAGVSSAEYFGDELNRIRLFGVDVSEAVDVAAKRFSERGYDNAAFMQADISDLPFPERSVDPIFSEGVLHHTDSTRGAPLSLAKLPKPGGWFLFYVYRRKGPVRESPMISSASNSSLWRRSRRGTRWNRGRGSAWRSACSTSRSTFPRQSTCSKSRRGQSMCSGCSIGTWPRCSIIPISASTR